MVENKGSSIRCTKINITFPDWVKVGNIIPRNMIINLGCASVDNHIPRDDIFDYHPIRICNIYIIQAFPIGYSELSQLFFFLLNAQVTHSRITSPVLLRIKSHG